MSKEVMILGATGRSSRAVAARLVAEHGTEVSLVLVGRDAVRLRALAEGLDAVAVVAATPAAAALEVERQRPAVVLNTIGPFTTSGPLVARACLPHSSYVDIANELFAVTGVLGLHEDAVAAGRTLVTGAAFGVLATESVVLRLCEGGPTPQRVRVDAIASLAVEQDDVLGEALAATITDGAATGGRRYEGGRLVRSWFGGPPQRLTLPDGGTVTTGGMTSGELQAAWLASGAPSVTVTSGLAPTRTAVRAVLPLAGALMAIPPLRRLATRRLAGTRLPAGPAAREHSYGHAVVEWPDGTVREGWLRMGDAMDFTVGVAAESVARLLRGQARPGSFTPARVFGAGLAETAGGTFLDAP